MWKRFSHEIAIVSKKIAQILLLAGLPIAH
jgi:hypothetical protein